MKMDRIDYILIGLVVLLLISLVAFMGFALSPVEYDCNSGDIDFNITLNRSLNIQHLELNGVDGLSCKGKIPSYMVWDLNG